MAGCCGGAQRARKLSAARCFRAGWTRRAYGSASWVVFLSLWGGYFGRACNGNTASASGVLPASDCSTASGVLQRSGIGVASFLGLSPALPKAASLAGAGMYSGALWAPPVLITLQLGSAGIL